MAIFVRNTCLLTLHALFVKYKGHLIDHNKNSNGVDLVQP